MLQYVEFKKILTEDERHYYITPPEGVEMVNDYQVAALVFNGVQVAAVNHERNCYSSKDFWWTEVCQDKGEFAVAVTIPPGIEGGWNRSKDFYEKYLHAVSGNRDCVYWAALFADLGVKDSSLEDLLSNPVIPYPLQEDLSELKRLACFIGIEKMVTLVTKTTYEGVEGEKVKVDEALIGNCCAYYRNLRHLGHTTLGKTVRYRDWRKVYRVLTEWYQEVCPAPDINEEEEKVQFSISPQQKAVDGITVDEYTLRIPKTGGELIQWGEWMGNCLIHYTKKVCQGTVVVGVFSNDSIFYALEIENGFLVQFRGLSNLVNPGLALKAKILDVLGEAGLLNLVQKKRERKQYLFPNPDYVYCPDQEEIDFWLADYYIE